MSLRSRVRALSRRFEASHRLRTESPILAEMRRVAECLREGAIRFLAGLLWDELDHFEYAEKIFRGKVSLADCQDAIERARDQMDIEKRREIGAYIKLSAQKLLADLRAEECRERHERQEGLADS
jgi:hypothetical protein